MFDEAPLTWVDAPPPPAAGPAVMAIASTVTAALAAGEAVTLVGATGSGRRTAALHAVAALARGARTWCRRSRGGRPRRCARSRGRLGVISPGGLRPETLLTLASGAMRDAPGGVVVVDARLRADPALLAMLRPPAGWRAILLAPAALADDRAWGARIALPPPPPLAPPDGDDAAVLAAAAWFDPWEGAPRALVPAVADREPAATQAALDRLLAGGHLRAARDPRRVLPPLALHERRPDLAAAAGTRPRRALRRGDRHVVPARRRRRRPAADRRSRQRDDRARAVAGRGAARVGRGVRPRAADADRGRRLPAGDRDDLRGGAVRRRRDARADRERAPVDVAAVNDDDVVSA
jgi:hypothetical protein